MKLSPIQPSHGLGHSDTFSLSRALFSVSIQHIGLFWLLRPKAVEDKNQRLSLSLAQVDGMMAPGGGSKVLYQNGAELSKAKAPTKRNTITPYICTRPETAIDFFSK